MGKIYSHKNKELQVHLNGVLDKSKRRGFHNTLIEFASIFHDIGKTNSNFQNKLLGTSMSGYSNHSYLSIYLSIYLLLNNNKIKNKYFNIFKNNSINFNIISNIITRHHGNLRNIDNIFENSEIQNTESFLNENENTCFTDFINDNFEEFKDTHCESVNKFNKYIFNGICVNKNDYDKKWVINPLKNYYDTIFNFAQLIEADKRDASDNDTYLLDNISKYNYLFNNNLNKFLDNLKIDSELNKIRTDIRTDSVNNLLEGLKDKNNRMFELTAPTGAGKTFMMLKLANIIQQEKGDYGIIMTLPFTSIIDQSSNICENELMLDVLNYTSTSNCSVIMDKLLTDESNVYYNKKNIINYNFSEETFDNPFIITTFVQFFQTIIANKNSVLIKLPNFTKRIFLIDEFQSIPNSLYTFFYGMLQYFCETYDCYCILSTATMPNFRLNNKKTSDGIDPCEVFTHYKTPKQLLIPEKYYSNDIFNRYKIENIGDHDLSSIVNVINTISNDKSTLVIMNTINDSIDLYNYIDHDNKYLLNSNFTSIDKQRIINEVKNDLKNNIKVLLVTTQIVEAGVDIDFPVEFRDLCPLPSLIQSAGRCNRNGKLEGFGEIFLFKYYELNKKDEKKYRSGLIYDRYDLNFVDENIKSVYEKDLLKIQNKYHDGIMNYKEVGKVKKYGENENTNLLELVYKGKIEDLGDYRLIEKDENQKLYYVGDDSLWDEFRNVYNETINLDYESFKITKIKLNIIHKKITKMCINVKINKKDSIEPPYSDEIMEIRNLSDKSIYNSYTGFDKNDTQFTFI